MNDMIHPVSAKQRLETRAMGYSNVFIKFLLPVMVAFV